MTQFQKDINEAIKENNINGSINPAYDFSILSKDGGEIYQIVDEEEIDELCGDRRNYDGFPCASFYSEDKKILFRTSISTKKCDYF